MAELAELAGRVFVVLDDGSSDRAADVARALAEAGASVVTLHGEDRGADGRGVFAGDPGAELDVEAAKTMAAELFGPVDAVLDAADLPAMPDEAVRAVLRRFPASRTSGD